MKSEKKKPRKISFLADEGLVRIVDEYCRLSGQTRSHMIRASLVYYLSEHHTAEEKDPDPDPDDANHELRKTLGSYFLTVTPTKDTSEK